MSAFSKDFLRCELTQDRAVRQLVGFITPRSGVQIPLLQLVLFGQRSNNRTFNAKVTFVNV